MSQHPFRFGLQLHTATDADSWSATARQAEDLGYSTLFMPDHFGDQLAPVPALMAAAAATTTLRVGALVFDNDYKHPVVLAKEAATIDLLSDGRLELGLGAGWMRSDYDESGIPFDRPGVRIDRLEEGLAIVKGLMSGEAFDFKGEHYQVAGLAGLPLPVQRPHPPILIGGGGKRVLRLAGREADIVGINVNMAAGEIGPDAGPNATAEATAEKVSWIKEGAGSRFDDIELNVLVFFTSITEDRAGVAEAMAGGFNISPQQALATPHALVGTVEEIVEDLHARREAFGISYTVVNETGFTDLAPVIERLAGS